MISIIFSPIFASHIAIMTTTINQQCGTFDTYSTIYTIHIIILVGLTPSILLGVFGYLTYRNVKEIQVRFQTMFNIRMKTDYY